MMGKGGDGLRRVGQMVVEHENAAAFESSLGLTVINALTAADSVIIPVQAHILAAQDMGALFKTIGRVRRQLNPHLQVDGICMTMVDARTNLARTTAKSIRENYGSLVRVFQSEIPFAIRAVEVPEKGQSIYGWTPFRNMPISRSWTQPP